MKIAPILLTTALLPHLVWGSEISADEPSTRREGALDLNGDFFQWLKDDPGELYRNKKNPWIDQVKLSGRFHYQFGRVDGEDVRGNSFENDFDEFRRARVGVEVDFLKYFELKVSVNLVDDSRFEVGPGSSLDWGFDSFDSVELEFDLGDAFGKGPFDEIKLIYGRMKLNISEEVHTSSNNLRVIERSNLSDRLGGDESRPTGFTLAFEKGDWTTVFGVFSDDGGSDLFASFNTDLFYYGSLEWEISDHWTLLFDHAQTSSTATSGALGYRHGTSLAASYDSKRWGATANLIYGQGSDDEDRNPLREGSFYGAVFTPWLWIVKDRLQFVGRYHYARAEETEGLRLQNRYVRALHLPPTTDLDGGYGDELHSFYLGLNWHLGGNRPNILAAVSHDLVSARTGNVSATTYLLAFRTSF